MINKVLLIDDDKSFWIIMERALIDANMDCELLTAKSGEEGIALAKEHKPELILCDKRMPILDGIDTAKQINEICDWDTKIILITDTPVSTDKVRMEEIGINNYFIKPTSYESLLRFLQQNIK